MSAYSAAGFGFGSVGCVTINVEDHVACDISDGRIRMGGDVVQELGKFKGSGFGALGLGCGKGDKGYGHGAVDGAAVVQEGSNDLLYACDAVAFERRTGVV